MRSPTLAAVLLLAPVLGFLRAHGGEDGQLANPFAKGDLVRDWERTSTFARVEDGVLVLDARRARTAVAVFRKDKAFTDVRLAAEFRMPTAGSGDRVFGLIFASTDSRSYFALEVGQAKLSLVRASSGSPLRRISSWSVRPPADGWTVVRLDRRGEELRATYQGRTLVVRQVEGLEAGLIGCYARGERVEVRGLEFGGTAARLREAWRLQPATGKAKP